MHWAVQTPAFSSPVAWTCPFHCSTDVSGRVPCRRHARQPSPSALDARKLSRDPCCLRRRPRRVRRETRVQRPRSDGVSTISCRQQQVWRRPRCALLQSVALRGWMDRALSVRSRLSLSLLCWSRQQPAACLGQGTAPWRIQLSLHHHHNINVKSMGGVVVVLLVGHWTCNSQLAGLSR